MPEITPALQRIIEIIGFVQLRINRETDLMWTPYDNAHQLLSILEPELEELKQGNLKSLPEYKLRFSPAGLFQEIATTNGWGDEFVKLADEFDFLMNKVVC